MLDNDFLPLRYSPSAQRAHGHLAALKEVARQAVEADEDIRAAFARGDDLRGPVANMQVAWMRFDETYTALCLEFAALSGSAQAYAKALDPILKP